MTVRVVVTSKMSVYESDNIELESERNGIRLLMVKYRGIDRCIG